MSDYSKITNFLSKDSLALNDPSKYVKGSEIDAEFNAIATAVATKADTASPTLVTPNIGAATGTSLALGGGTALTTTNRTGTGNLVLATAPTLTGLTVSGGNFVSRGITDSATATALTLSGSGANSVTIANSATNPTIGTSAGNLAITPSVIATGYYHAFSGTATTAGGYANPGFYMGNAFMGVFWGSGAPTVSAAKGSLYLRSDGTTTNNRMYVNTDGGTTWTAVTTAA